MRGKTALAALGVIIFIILVVLGFRLQREDAPVQADPGEALYGEAADSMVSAVAVLSPSGETEVHGRVTFTETDRGLHIVADLRGLAPTRHEMTLARAPSCDSLPEPTAVTKAETKAAKAGSESLPPFDFAVAFSPDENSSASVDEYEADLSLTNGNSIVGHSVVIHRDSDPDDNQSSRVACGRVGDITFMPVRDEGALPLQRERTTSVDPSKIEQYQ
jgi:Cu/Zn superoxide dismutase